MFQGVFYFYVLTFISESCRMWLFITKDIHENIYVANNVLWIMYSIFVHSVSVWMSMVGSIHYFLFAIHHDLGFLSIVSSGRNYRLYKNG